MAIHDSNTGAKGTLYRGNYEPAEWSVGDKKIAGWKEESQTGTALTFKDTYNDSFLSAKIEGKTEVKCEWRNKEAESTQQMWTGKNKLDTFQTELGAFDQSTGAKTTGISMQVRTSYAIPLSQGQTIVYSCDTTQNTRIFVFDLGNEYIGTQSMPPNTAYTAIVDCLIYVVSSAAGFLLVNKYQYEIGSVATSYEPYVGGIPAPNPDYPQPITTTIPAGTYRVQDYKGDWYEFTLPSDLHGIGDVRDSVEWDKYSHAGFARIKTSEIVLDGTETWSVYASRPNHFQLSVGDNSFGPIINPIISSHFPARKENNYYYSNGDYSVMSVDGSRIRFKHKDISDLPQWTALVAAQYTAGTPVTVVYQLATPTRTPLTFTLNNASTAPELPLDFLTDTPSADYPATIFSAAGEVVVRGRNLLDLDNTTSVLNSIRLPNQKLRSNINNSYFSSINSDVTLPVLFIKNLGETYTFSCDICPPNTRLSIVIYGTRTTGQSNQETNGVWGSPWVSITVSNTFTTITRVELRFNRMNTLHTDTTTVFGNFQVEPGSVATPYEPYRQPQTVPFLALRSINDIKDEFDVLTGKVERKVSSVYELGGNLTWNPVNSFTGRKQFGTLRGVFPTSITNGINATVLKYNSIPLNVTPGSFAVDDFYIGGSNFNILASETDTGMPDALTPTPAEIKSYFYGWKICHSDGASPYQRSEIPYNPNTWAEWVVGSSVVVNTSGLEYTVNEYGSATAGITAPIRPNINYGFIVDVISSDGNIKLMVDVAGYYFQGSQVERQIPDIAGKYKVLLTSLSSINAQNPLRIVQIGSAGIGNKIKIKDIRLFELPPGSQIEADFNNLSADALAIKYKFYGENPKHWKRLVGTEAEIRNSITSTLPTESYDGFTPYRMIYELETPVIEQLEPTELKTYPHTTIAEVNNDTPAKAEITATVKTVDLN